MVRLLSLTRRSRTRDDRAIPEPQAPQAARGAASPGSKRQCRRRRHALASDHGAASRAQNSPALRQAQRERGFLDQDQDQGQGPDRDLDPDLDPDFDRDLDPDLDLPDDDGGQVEDQDEVSRPRPRPGIRFTPLRRSVQVSDRGCDIDPPRRSTALRSGSLNALSVVGTRGEQPARAGR
jgi:hypothetical protein